MRVKRRLLSATLASLLVGGVSVAAWLGVPPRAVDAAPASKAPAASRPIDQAQVDRLQRVMLPLVKGMNHPVPPDKIRVGLADDEHINAASAGGGQFIVTRGLLEKANDDQLRGVLAHELGHEDLGHVAKAQTLGTGVKIGIGLLEQFFPGSSAVTPLAGQLLLNHYTQTEEYAADRQGAAILQRVGYRREIMADTLTWLMRVEGGSSGGFFATHPATEERIQALHGLR